MAGKPEENWPAYSVLYAKAEKPEDRLTAEQGAGMVDLIIDILRQQAAEQIAMGIVRKRDEQRGHEDA